MVKYNEAATLHDTASVENDIWIGIAKDKKACFNQKSTDSRIEQQCKTYFSRISTSCGWK